MVVVSKQILNGVMVSKFPRSNNRIAEHKAVGTKLYSVSIGDVHTVCQKVVHPVAGIACSQVSAGGTSLNDDGVFLDVPLFCMLSYDKNAPSKLHKSSRENCRSTGVSKDCNVVALCHKCKGNGFCLSVRSVGISASRAEQNKRTLIDLQRFGILLNIYCQLGSFKGAVFFDGKFFVYHILPSQS